MILQRSPDGMQYGRYGDLGNGQFGFIPVIAAAISAAPAILQMFNPQPPPAAPLPQPQSNLPLIAGVGLGGLMIAGGIAYLVLKK